MKPIARRQKLMEHIGQHARSGEDDSGRLAAPRTRNGRRSRPADHRALLRAPAERDALIERILQFPGIADVLARGENKVSFKLRSGMQIDVRILPPDSFGAALQYFTGSKAHNVALRQRALKHGIHAQRVRLVHARRQRTGGRRHRRGNLRQARPRLDSARVARELR